MLSKCQGPAGSSLVCSKPYGGSILPMERNPFAVSDISYSGASSVLHAFPLCIHAVERSQGPLLPWTRAPSSPLISSPTAPPTASAFLRPPGPILAPVYLTSAHSNPSQSHWQVLMAPPPKSYSLPILFPPLVQGHQLLPGDCDGFLPGIPALDLAHITGRTNFYLFKI